MTMKITARIANPTAVISRVVSQAGREDCGGVAGEFVMVLPFGVRLFGVPTLSKAIAEKAKKYPIPAVSLFSSAV
ncbi:hypothetical protein GCM10009569_30040 [Arthrobacter russicus]